MANLGHDLNKNDFRVYLETKAGKDAPEDSVTLNFWCFSAGVAMQTLMNKAQPHSLIITIGTLSPMNAFAAELKIPFPIKLSNNHVITKENLLVGVVKKGPNGKNLTSSYAARGD